MTALEKQVQEIKVKYPNSIVLLQCGNFYEAINEDAEKIINILGLVKTENKGMILAGFEAYYLTDYLPKLIKAGHTVALVEDITDKKPVNVKRSKLH